jgi:hypothetical protein
MPRRHRPGLPLQDHRRQLTTHTEVTAFGWADETDIRQLTTQAYAIRFLDALSRDARHPAARRNRPHRLTPPADCASTDRNLSWLTITEFRPGLWL